MHIIRALRGPMMCKLLEITWTVPASGLYRIYFVPSVYDRDRTGRIKNGFLFTGPWVRDWQPVPGASSCAIPTRFTRTPHTYNVTSRSARNTTGSSSSVIVAVECAYDNEKAIRTEFPTYTSCVFPPQPTDLARSTAHPLVCIH